MNISKQDREVLQKLAEKIANIASLPVHNEKINMWKKLNSLKSIKPMIYIDNIPWHEIGIEKGLKLKTRNEFFKKVEARMWKTIYRWENARVDMVVEPKVICPLVIKNSGFGFDEIQDITAVDSDDRIHSFIESRHFSPKIKDEDDIQKIKMPKITYDKDTNERNYQMMSEIFKGILKVEKCGTMDFWFAPWDDLITWLGIEEGMTALALRPQFIHKCMERLIQANISMLDQYEKMNLLTLNNGNYRTGSGGLGYTDQLPQPDFNPKKVKAADLWGFSAAQIFTDISPQMHEEFATNYEIRWLKRFGLNYYGCCETLHKKIDIAKKVPNLRKISISPFADPEEAALHIGDSYVLSVKLNPSILAEEFWDPERARREIIDTLEKTKGSHVEILMKDISTVRNQPQRLWEWARIADEAIQDFVNI